MLSIVISLTERNSRHRRAVYRCVCGVHVIALVDNVRTGHTKSCGCLRRAVNSERFTTHGHKSGGKRTATYAAWVNMKSRCNNPKAKQYSDYGGRGITVCERWGNSFENFLADMGEKPPRMTIDRENNDGNYEPGNCRWATRSTQGLNKRNNVRYELNGKSQTLSEWSRETGIGRVTLLKRIQAGIPLDLALTVKGFLGYRRSIKEALPP
jgi:hypothetical protein